MSSRSKRRRRVKKVPIPVPPSVRREETEKHGATASISEPDLSARWALLGGAAEEAAHNVYAMKVLFLGPFLFGQSTLSEQAKVTATDSLLLPADSDMWPMFFEKDKWRRVQVVVKVLTTTIKLCETNKSFREYTTDPDLPQEDSMVEIVQQHSGGLADYPLSEVEQVFKVVRIHVAHFTATAETSRLGRAFMQTLADKEQLVAPMKDRGNTNFRETRYRAGIADYTRAIKLCPYSPVLYCNRAMCYLKNQDFWCACVDSYRALVLRPDWEKPYYRCAEAWLRLGDVNTAVAMNKSGREACSERADLERQYKEIQDLITAASNPSAALGKAARKKRAKERKHLDTAPPNGGQRKETGSSKSDCTSSRMDRKNKLSLEHNHVGGEDGRAGEDGPIRKQKEKKGERNGSAKPGTSPSNSKEDPQPSPFEPFTNFETLCCPTVGNQVSMEQLRQYCREVKLNTLIPSTYTTQSQTWEQLETHWVDPPLPTTDRTAVYEPMTAHFDEIWCPILADVKGAENIVPPTFHYLPSNACVRQSYTPPFGYY